MKNNLQQFTSKSGVNFLFYKRNDVSGLIVSCWIKHDRHTILPGAAHFLEHCLLDMEEDRRSLNLSKEEADIWNLFDGQVYNDFIHLSLYCHSRKILVGLKTFFKMIFNRKLGEVDIKKIKGPIIQELNDRLSDIDILLYDTAVKNRIKEPEIISKRIIGSKEDIEIIDRGILLETYKKMIVPENIFIVIAGNFDTDTVTDIINNTLDSKQEAATGLTQSGENITYSDKNFCHIEKDLGESINLYLTFPSLQYFEDNAEALMKTNLLASILSDMQYGRLFKKLRLNKQLVYSVSCGTYYNKDYGMFTIECNTSAPHLLETLEIISEELNQIKNSPVPELGFYINYFNDMGELEYDSFGPLVSYFEEDFARGEPIMFPEDISSIRNKFKQTDINKVAQDTFDFSKINLITSGKLSEAIKNQVNNFLAGLN